MNTQQVSNSATIPAPLANVAGVKQTLTSLRATHAAILAIRPILEARKLELTLSKVNESGHPDSKRKIERIDRHIGNLLNGGGEGDKSIGNGTSQLELRWAGVDYIGLSLIPAKLEQLQSEIDSISQLLPLDSDLSQARASCSGIECSLEATRGTYTLEYAKAIEHLIQARLFLSNACGLQADYNSQVDSMAAIKSQFDLRDVSIPARMDAERNQEMKADRDKALILTSTIRNMIVSERTGE